GDRSSTTSTETFGCAISAVMTIGRLSRSLNVGTTTTARFGTAVTNAALRTASQIRQETFDDTVPGDRARQIGAGVAQHFCEGRVDGQTIDGIGDRLRRRLGDEAVDAVGDELERAARI